MKRKFTSFKLILAGFFSGLLTWGCSTPSGPEFTPLSSDKGPVRLELKPPAGYEDVTDYISRTVTKTYSNGEITRKISEGIDFSVETKVTAYDSEKKIGTYRVTTIKKDGKLDLSDFAMPELGQSLDFVLTSTGRVLKVSEIPPGTLYFVPPVSLPDEEVTVGETWAMAADWLSLKSGLPLRIEVVSILKGLRRCGTAGSCAEIELSGGVKIIGAGGSNISSQSTGANDLRMRFRSELKGRMLVSLANGTVLYSIMRSDESLSGASDSVEISSCMMSYVTKPDEARVLKAKVADCDPLGDLNGTGIWTL